MRTRTLPRHPRTGQLALGWRTARPGEDSTELYPVWPILGGAEDDGGDQDDGDDSDTDDDADESDADDDQGGDDKVDHKADAAKWRALAKKHEARAKANASAAKELAKIRREGMNEADKKVDEAVAAAVAQERVKAGERVARSAFLAAATGRLDNAKDVADDVNLRRYVDDEGEVDEDGIAELVDRLAPKRSDKDKNDEDDDRESGRDKRRRGRGFDQGARRGSGRGSGGGVAAGRELYASLLGKGADKS
ncbi:hypothetical protein ACIQPP_05565 [Streptomyces violaceusniger]|uniref:hypothetical protein n=1 Tax=Streptomyces violaceusniger TaxID=68280 RepID=UPI000996BF2A|nr:hypothetical protein [Streptomyces hygroscopicus]AQW55288.1 hypothetical protein SHXM_08751 [Streptomyces hygroscopicus]